jgi:NADPH:quinone reductase-like Zn-dependent oxidoreductase
MHSGGVGSFALRHAKGKQGAIAYIPPPAVKCRLGQSLGADRVIDYKRKIKRLQTI